MAQLLAARQIRVEWKQAAAAATPCTVYRFEHGGVPVQIFDSRLARPFQAATREEGLCFLALYERLLERFRPNLVLTYGGDWVAQVPRPSGGASRSSSPCTTSPTTAPTSSARWMPSWCPRASPKPTTAARWD